MAELRARLRTATAPFHARVDAAYGNFAFAQPGGYARFLRAHGRVLGSVEVALEQAGIAGLLDDWPARVRRHALLADLDCLGSPAPEPLPPPQLPDIASCWGAAYVLEGSRLGGQILARQLHQLDPTAPARYLQHGEIARLWPSFLTRLETAPSASWPAMLTAAEAVFELFTHAAALEQCEQTVENGKGPEGPFHRTA